MGELTIKLTKGRETVVDSDDADLATIKWYALTKKNARRVYACRDDKNTRQLIHRVILERILGRPLEAKEQVDHRDGDGLNNRRENLRLATASENQRNQHRDRTNTSGFKGACWDKSVNRWKATIKVNRKCIHLGRFDTPEEAHAAYCAAAIKYHGEFARLE